MLVTICRKLGGAGAIGRAEMNYVYPSEPLCARFGVERDRDYLDGFCILRKYRGRVLRTGCVID
jgi:hypothetical protein